MGKQHLDLLALAPGGDPLVFLRECPRHIAGSLVDRAHDLARIGAGAALPLQWARIAVHLARPIAEEAVGVRGIVGLGSAVPAEALELLAGRAEISILLAVEGEGLSVERAIGPPGLVEHRHMRLD